jgi:hypothetical protein
MGKGPGEKSGLESVEHGRRGTPFFELLLEG